MPKYIKAVDAADKFSEISGTPLCELVDIMCAIHAADVAEVVHGKWMQCKTSLGKIYSVCSNCKTDFKFKTDKGTFARLDMNGMPYCPNCGAKMDKEEKK